LLARQGLANADLSNMLGQFNLGKIHIKVGNAELKSQHRAEAVKQYEEATKFLSGLPKRPPYEPYYKTAQELLDQLQKAR